MDATPCGGEAGDGGPRERNEDRWFSSLIPNGVDPRVFKPGPGPRTKFDLPTDAPVILMVSALIPSKNVLEGIRAVARLPDAHLVVAGDALLDRQAHRVRHHLGNRPGRQPVALPAIRLQRAGGRTAGRSSGRARRGPAGGIAADQAPGPGGGAGNDRTGHGFFADVPVFLFCYSVIARLVHAVVDVEIGLLSADAGQVRIRVQSGFLRRGLATREK